MTTSIDLRTIPASTPSLCIPRVFTNIKEERIRRIFDELKLGEIERVDIVPKMTEKGEKFNRVFIHFKRWGTDGNAEKARQRLLNGQDIKIIYGEPWFWKISAYRPSQSQKQPNRRPEQKTPRLELDDGRPDDRRRPERDDRQRPEREDRQRPRSPERQRPRSPDFPPPNEKSSEE